MDKLSEQDKIAMQLNEEAVQLAGAGKQAEAAAGFDKAIAAATEAGPGMPVLLTNRAATFIILERLDEAIADCTRAVKLDPKYAGAFLAHSKALAYKGNLQQALDLLRSAAKDDALASLKPEIAALEVEQGYETAVAKSDPSRQKMNQYHDWLKQQKGVECSKVKVRMTNQRQTVAIATKDIRKGEPVLFMPENLIVLPTNAVDGCPANSWLLWNPKVAERVPAEQKDVVSLALYYLHEKNNSKWHHQRYFASLVQDNTNQVVRWSEADLEVLKGTSAHYQVAGIRKEVAAVYDFIQKEVPAESRGEFTLDEYLQAVAFADRHLVSVQSDSAIKSAMAPLLNYFNADFNSNTTNMYTETGLQVIASRDIARGAEVTLAAPAHSGNWLLMKRGEVKNVPTRVNI